MRRHGALCQASDTRQIAPGLLVVAGTRISSAASWRWSTLLADLATERSCGSHAFSVSIEIAAVPQEDADLMHAFYKRITVTGRAIVSIRLTLSAYAHGLGVTLPTKVALARPTGVGRAISTYTIPIEGRDEWLAAARRLA